LLSAIGEPLGWDIGVLWHVDRRARVVRCSEVWHLQAVAVPRFVAACRQHALASGEGLPGRVWQNAAPAWVPDVVQDNNFPRAAVAAAEGLHGAFGFP